MCGITGILKFGKEAEIDSSVLARMCSAMAHRGPDDQGIHVENRVGLGMRRLSIVDLATGHQPIGNEDGTIWIVFNGEIYNHLTLRQQLIGRGHRFSTQSDTETILHLFEEYGRDCVHHLRGMFAFAIWNRKDRSLFLARDRFGIKPLYYTQTSGSFLFGSEIKVLLAHKDVHAEFHRACLPEYLAFGYLSGEETFYRGIYKLMPGHWLEVDEFGKFQTEQYWDISSKTDASSGSEAEWVERYRALFEDAVRSHLMSDVPLGVFLSGGLDSSAVAGVVTKLRGAPVETFSVGYSEQKHSELPFARIVAKHLHSVHSEVLLSEQEFFGALPRLIWHEDEPIAWPSSVALYFVARLAAQRVKVVLTGEGSDETLAGYARYAFTVRNEKLDRVYRRGVPLAMRGRIRDFLSNSNLIGAALRRKVSHTFLSRNGNSWESLYFDNFFSAFSESEQACLFHEEVIREFQPGSAYRSVLNYWESSDGEMLHRLLYTDIKTYMVELLMKQDQMSMAASIESRVPFLDHPLVEFAMSIPQNMTLKGLAGKQILKNAVEDLLPPSIIHRKKQGFPTPWRQWLAGARLDLVEDLLCEQRSMDRNLFRKSAIEQLFREHRQGYKDHHDRIWRLLNLELWHRVCLEGDLPERLQLTEANLASLA